MFESYAAKRYSILVDYETNAVLTVGVSTSALVFLKECMPDTYYSASVNLPNYKGLFFGGFFLASVAPAEYPKWTWDRKKRVFRKTNPEVLTEALMARSRLASAKHKVISSIMNNISFARYPVATGIAFQETVYLEKKMQARAFRNSGYNEDMIMEYPYVVQYADFAGLSLRQAADDILLKAKFDDEILAKTELLRLKYFDKVRRAESVEELRKVAKDFIRVCYVNAKV